MDQRKTHTHLGGAHDDGEHEIRCEIAQTRERMDDTLDQIAERLQPRHLIDDLLGWLRSSPDGMEQARNKAKVMGTSIIHWIEEHPMPVLLLGGAVATYIYESRKDRREFDLDDEEWAEADEGFTSDFGASQPPSEWSATETSAGAGITGSAYGEEESSARGKVRETMGAARRKARELSGRARQSLARARYRARETGTRLRERGSAGAERVRHRATEMWSAGRHQLDDAVEDYPIGVGLGFLALGVLTGLLVPRTRAEEELMGETSRRVRERTRGAVSDAIQRGREVASAAGSAAAREAEAQGLTPEQLAEKAGAVAKSATEAGKETLRQCP
jgi:hypothetical protein